jgi:hypothetical protein
MLQMGGRRKRRREQRRSRPEGSQNQSLALELALRSVLDRWPREICKLAAEYAEQGALVIIRDMKARTAALHLLTHSLGSPIAVLAFPLSASHACALLHVARSSLLVLQGRKRMFAVDLATGLLADATANHLKLIQALNVPYSINRNFRDASCCPARSCFLVLKQEHAGGFVGVHKYHPWGTEPYFEPTSALLPANVLCLASDSDCLWVVAQYLEPSRCVWQTHLIWISLHRGSTRLTRQSTSRIGCLMPDGCGHQSVLLPDGEYRLQLVSAHRVALLAQTETGLSISLFDKSTGRLAHVGTRRDARSYWPSAVFHNQLLVFTRTAHHCWDLDTLRELPFPPFLPKYPKTLEIIATFYVSLLPHLSLSLSLSPLSLSDVADGRTSKTAAGAATVTTRGVAESKLGA